MRKLALTALLVVLPVTALQAMTVAVFLEKAEALKAQGMTAMFSSDVGLLKNEIKYVPLDALSKLCEFLIEQGADVNHALPDTGETPLHAALCKANRPAYNLVLKVLLANGADPNRVTNAGVETGSFMRDCRTRGGPSRPPDFVAG